MSVRWKWMVLTALMIVGSRSTTVAAQALEENLMRVPAAELAELARTQGDAARGAVLFFQPYMACSSCHSVTDDDSSALGPNLAALDRDVTGADLVESVLLPSKTIRCGFESVTAVTDEGETVVGLLVQRTQESLVLRDVRRNGEQFEFSVEALESVHDNTQSIMPSGQMNQLTSQQQFFDLIRYLIEIRDGGPERARQLQPPATLLTFSVPEYEQRIDHAGLISSWTIESLERGEAVYRRVCANCHGTISQPGSLPTSLRFAEGKFRNGSDPWAMYQTLTYGFGQMAAQSWMVPSQKYDVIHYIREAFLRPYNPSQYVPIDAAYLAGLPKGDTRGPEPVTIEPWSAMDYGPTLTHTYEVPGDSLNIAYKGIAIRLDSGAGGIARGRHWMLFDTDTLRFAAAWSAPAADAGPSHNGATQFIDWRGIQFNGEHQVHPHIVGVLAWANAIGPGWADPRSGSFEDDHRVFGRDGRRYGPLPRAWGRFRGLYHHGQQAILAYSVGNTDVLESPRVVASKDRPDEPMFLRTINVGPRDQDLILQIADRTSDMTVYPGAGSSGPTVAFGRLPGSKGSDGGNAKWLVAGVVPAETPVTWVSDVDCLRLQIPAGNEPLRFTLWTAAGSEPPVEPANVERPSVRAPSLPDADQDLSTLLDGGPPRWPERLATTATIGADDKAFAVDVLTAPESNPWLARTRFTGLDFFADGRLAVCTWDGDVWVVTPERGSSKLQWQRIASGLFQPLGLKIVDDKIHVTCRDQLAVLHDLNGDGETDFYECFNNDHQVTEHFHEFAMGLQTDAEGNFYYAKSARHALPAVVPHHGTLLRIHRDGTRTDILANGFRAANGVCINPDGSFVVTDQEGHWIPKNRINWITPDPSGQPKFYGNMFGYHGVVDTSDAAMEQPLCWITNAFDRSPAELLWVDSPSWGPLNGSLLNLSYGYGKVFVVLHERVGDVMQGGMIALPLPRFPTGIMRGRYSPRDEQLYVCGMFAWAGSATEPGGLYRIRATGLPMQLPMKLHARRAALELTFTEPLDLAELNADSVKIKTWTLKRTADYGSKHYDEKPLAVHGMALSSDNRTVTLDVPDLAPTWCMQIEYAFRTRAGEPVQGVIQNTIHQLSD